MFTTPQSQRRSPWARFTDDERGMESIEYLLIAALVVIAAVAAWKFLGDTTGKKVVAVSGKVDEVVAGAVGKDGKGGGGGGSVNAGQGGTLGFGGGGGGAAGGRTRQASLVPGPARGEDVGAGGGNNGRSTNTASANGGRRTGNSGSRTAGGNQVAGGRQAGGSGGGGGGGRSAGPKTGGGAVKTSGRQATARAGGAGGAGGGGSSSVAGAANSQRQRQIENAKNLLRAMVLAGMAQTAGTPITKTDPKDNGDGGGKKGTGGGPSGKQGGAAKPRDPALRQLARDYNRTLQDYRRQQAILDDPKSTEAQRTNARERMRALDSALLGMRSEIKSKGGSVPSHTRFRERDRKDVRIVRQGGKPETGTSGGTPSKTRLGNPGFRKRTPLPNGPKNPYTDAIRKAEDDLLSHLTASRDEWIRRWQKESDPKGKLSDIEKGFKAAGAHGGRLGELARKLEDAKRDYALSQAGRATREEKEMVRKAKSLANQILAKSGEMAKTRVEIRKLEKQFRDFKKAIKFIESKRAADPVNKMGAYRVWIDHLAKLKKLQGLSKEVHRLSERMLNLSEKAVQSRLQRGLAEINRKNGAQKFKLYTETDYTSDAKGKQALRDLVNDAAIQQLERETGKRRKDITAALEQRRKNQSPILKKGSGARDF